MQKVATSTRRWVPARRRGIASLAACAAVLALPAAASAAALPTATTVPADPSLITDTYALISGVVNPNGAATVYWFEWGTTTSYGQATPVTAAGNGAADVPVDISLDTLKPATTYHYRVVARPAAGAAGAEVAGADQSFTTSPALALGFVGHSAHVSAVGKALVKLKAVGPPDEAATGVLKLTAKVGDQLRSFGSVSYKVATGSTETVRVRLTAAGRRALRAAAGKSVRVKATAKTSGIKRPVIESLALKP